MPHLPCYFDETSTFSILYLEKICIILSTEKRNLCSSLLQMTIDVYHLKNALQRFVKLVEWILQGLLKMGIHGATVSDVRGFGA